ncbi:hypothetical protein [uncultured Methanobrevibacter sp.]|uniref:hypothetical protein n=1 Tax=uncultured Methanobrevibacter sp. TaxID=253161 RepID=UPI0025D2269B|nr:hypothetical protein [uncultured Methanobrevibacter sp.]
MKKILIFLLLLILTIGAVSASDNTTDTESDMIEDNVDKKTWDIQVDEYIEALPCQNQIIEIYNYPTDTKANISISIDGVNQTLINSLNQYLEDEYDEYWIFDAANLTLGEYKYELNYLGDANYLPATKTGTINITPMIIEFPTNVPIEYNHYTDTKDSAISTVTIKYLNDIKGNLTLYVNGVKRILNLSDYDYEIYFPIGRYDAISDYAIKLDKSGQFYTFSEPLNIHKPTTLTATYNDDSININKTGIVNLIYELNCADEVRKGDDLEIYIPKSIKSKITVEVDGKPVKFYSKRIVLDYEYIYFYAKIGSLSYGNHTVKINYKGSADSPSQSEYKTFTVVHQPKVTPKTISVYYKDSLTCNFKIYGTDGKAVGTKYETGFMIDDNWDTRVWKNTKNKGKITYKVPNNLKPGIHTLNVYIDELNIDINVKLVVKHVVTLKTVTVKKSVKKLTLQATLKNSKAIKGKTVTFKFNGKTYKAKTNSKGIAKVTIPKSILSKLKVGKKITYQATYLKDTVKKTVKVSK